MPASWNVNWPEKRHLGHREHPVGNGSLCLSLNYFLWKENLSMFDLIFVLLLCISIYVCVCVYIYKIYTHSQKVGKKFTKISSYSWIVADDISILCVLFCLF